MNTVALGGDQSATLRERLTYGQARMVRAAMLAADADKAALADLDLELVKAYVSAWTVLDLAGEPVSLDTPELAPDDVIQTIAVKAISIWQGTAKIPKAGSVPSLTTLPGRRSKAKIAI